MHLRLCLLVGNASSFCQISISVLAQVSVSAQVSVGFAAQCAVCEGFASTSACIIEFSCITIPVISSHSSGDSGSCVSTDASKASTGPA